jgi:hypothetical protein
LEKFYFIEADAFVLKFNLLSKDNYERVRSRFIKEYIIKALILNYMITGLAIARTDKNLLVKQELDQARQHNFGKTHILSAVKIFHQ